MQHRSNFLTPNQGIPAVRFDNRCFDLVLIVVKGNSDIEFALDK